MNDLLVLLHQLNRITSDVADNAQAQFAAFYANVTTGSLTLVAMKTCASFTLTS